MDQLRIILHLVMPIVSTNGSNIVSNSFMRLDRKDRSNVIVSAQTSSFAIIGIGPEGIDEHKDAKSFTSQSQLSNVIQRSATQNAT
jgi:hypothetical protein